MNSLASNPQLDALGKTLGASDSQSPAPASPTPTGGGTPPVPPVERHDGGDGGKDGRHFRLPFWAAVVIGALLLLFCGYRVVYSMNWNAPFAVSDKLDHQGAWYRQAALAPVDWVRSREYFVEADFWGNKRVVYQVGDRQFIQSQSGAPAVEIYPTK
jgi:hypothetical protein